MKRTIAYAFALLFACSAMAEIRGSWTASLSDAKPGKLQMNMNRRQNHNFGNSMKISDFIGLTESVMNSTTMTPVQFRLVREAGTVSYEGVFRNGDGAGQFTFAANPAYASTLRSLGVTPDLKRRHRDDEDEEETDLFSLAVLDVSTAFIKSMQAEGYRVSLDKYLSMRIFNVTPEYIREMRGLGFKDIDVDELISTKIHKVTPEYIREMRAAGWDLDLDELQSSRIHGATPQFAEELKNLGYGGLDHDDLVSFRIHRVTPEFIRELRGLGYDKVKADDLVSMRIHRVTPEFIRQLKSAGYANVPVQKLISMRIHGIDAKFIEQMNDKD